MSYLIDGYNLLHAIGLVKGRAARPGALDQARRALLSLLHGAFREEAATLTVVFDAAKALPGTSEVQNHHGIEVRFAVTEPTADEVIETLIQRTAVPHQLAVVSNDRRIQEAARRKGCVVLSCGEFLDELDRRRAMPRKQTGPGSDKPQTGGPSETHRWLGVFRDLENDPAWKGLFDAYEFERPDLEEEGP
jgi:predicted RNA-binding protein with PIN domain